jgi:membrane protease YdiL (CAAX protease family)
MTVVRRLPLLCYFGLAFTLSSLALVVVGLPSPHHTTHKPAGSLVAFPIMVIGVGMIGIALTASTEGWSGIRELRSRLTRPVKRRWWLLLTLPPIAILGSLGALQAGVSANYAPGFLIFGFAAGAFAGFFEEFGWTGFAYPRMRARFGGLGGALLLGVLWGLWHFPVVDSLGAASPHCRYWPVFFASFVAAMVALRVLIAWVYVHTGSLRIAQLLHASSTGFLVVLGAPGATPGEEALWYGAYAALLWLVVVVVVAVQGSTLGARLHTRGQPRASLPAAAESRLGQQRWPATRPVGGLSGRARD